MAASPSPLHLFLLLLPPASAGNATGRGGGARAATRGAARENRADSSIPRSLTGAHAARACIGPVQSGWLRCSVKFALLCCPAWTCKVCGHGQLRLKKSPPLETRSPEFNLTQMRSGEGLARDLHSGSEVRGAQWRQAASPGLMTSCWKPCAPIRRQEQSRAGSSV